MIITAGQRNDLKEDLPIYRRYLITELEKLEEVESYLKTGTSELVQSDLCIRILSVRIEGAEKENMSSREYRDRLEFKQALELGK